MTTTTHMDPPHGVIVETSCGKVRGRLHRGVYTFRGIPYGAPTGGAHRFQAPRPTQWSGVRDAFALGPRSPQNEAATNAPHLTWLRDPTPWSESCLVLNVSTSALGAVRRPVIVYLHGGGFSSGSGGTPGVDGTNLARRETVVVTVNHRLNLFGHLHLGHLDERYRHSGNAGILDVIAALEWVKQNIALFGGDAANVTLCGQSGGGTKVAVLMAMPRAQGLFHKAIIQSASSLLAVATKEEAERNAHHFLKALDIVPSRLGLLDALPVETLLKAMPAAIRAAGSIDNYRPVVDGDSLPWQPFEPRAVQLSAHIPLLTGWCENEQRLMFASTPQALRQGPLEALAATALALDVSEQEAATVMEVYRRSRPLDSPADLYAQILGDHRYRRNVTRAAEQQAAAGAAQVYMYRLDWKTPILDGLLRSPHTLCLAFTFANADRVTGITGHGAERYKIQDEMSSAWLAFSRSGCPGHGGIPHWPPFTLSARSTLAFDRESHLLIDPMPEERLALEACPPYKPAVAEGRLR